MVSSVGVVASGKMNDIFREMGAVFAIDAADSVPGEQWALNKGTGGNVLRAKYGSVARAEIRNGVGLVLPGVAGNYASVSNSALFNPSNLTARCRIAADFYSETGGLYKAILSNGWDQAGQNGWFFGLTNSTTKACFYMSTNGTVTAGYEPPINLNTIVANGENIDLLVNRVSSTGGIAMYARPGVGDLESDAGWTLLGSSTLNAGITPWATTQGIKIGGSWGGPMNPFYGSISRAIVGTFGGSKALDVDFTKPADFSTSFVCDTGQTVTVTAANAVDTNDPLFLPHTGENYLYIPAVGGNVAVVPDSAALDITGDMEVVCRASSPPDSSATSRIFVNKSINTASEYSWDFETYGGSLYFVVTSGGTAATQQFGQATIPVAYGPVYWWKVTFNATLGRVLFYYAPDSPTEPTVWTAITNVRADFGAFTTYSGSAPIGIGASGIGASPLNGKMYRAIVRSGIGGTTVLDIDFTKNTAQSSFVCTTGQTVSLYRSSVNRKLTMVTRPVWLFGTDDYMEVADNALLNFGLNQDFSVVTIVRQHGSGGGYMAYVSKTNPDTYNTLGFLQGRNTGDRGTFLQMFLNDGAAHVTPLAAQPYTDGSITVLSTIRSTTTGYHAANTAGPNGVASVGADITNILPMRIGYNPTGSGMPLDGEVFAVAVFRRALSVAEIAAIVSTFGAS